jgi:hypothetical protein
VAYAWSGDVVAGGRRRAGRGAREGSVGAARSAVCPQSRRGDRTQARRARRTLCLSAARVHDIVSRRAAARRTCAAY